MNSAVCTLFEGHYHNGVAALANSLFRQGFRGDFFVGYKGELPYWASKATMNKDLAWKGATKLNLGFEFSINFLPLETYYHLTNYKPDFMLELLNLLPDSEAIFYLDPDIIVTNPWYHFENWILCGIAVCEDVNSPISKFHPRRVAWRNFYGKKGIELIFKDSIYVNGGFVGLSRNNISFLEKWKIMQEAMAEAIGGLSYSAFPGKTISKGAQGPFSPFGKTDQDALNATIEAWDGAISFMGQEAMAFKPGKSYLPHALGQPKPWHWKPLQQALKGRPPRTVDKEFWNSVNGPILFYSKRKITLRKVGITIAAVIGRFYHKNKG